MSEIYRRSWSDLIPDLLSIISNKIKDPVELLAFRATCRSWQLASTNAKNKLKESSFDQIPWLLYQESDDTEKCIVHNFTTKNKYKINIPELIGTNILGSFQGWLLIFNPVGGKIFFLCPFSRQQINLPDIGRQCIMRYDSIAVLDHRTICIVARASYLYVDIYILRSGAQTWDNVHAYCNSDMLEALTGGTFQQDGNLILYNYKDKTKAVMYDFEIDRLEIIPRLELGEEPINHPVNNNEEVWNVYNDRKTFVAMEDYLESNSDVRRSLSMDDQTLAPVFVWGTRFRRDPRGNEAVLSNESNVDQERRMCNICMGLRRAIWIQPRLFVP